MFEWIMTDPEICERKSYVHNLRLQISRLLDLLASGETVETILQTYPSLCSHLRASRARYEYGDEAQWARRFAGHSSPVRGLSSYPNYEHYLKIVNFEMSRLTQAHPADFEQALMIGSGPLPMTALLLAQHFSLSVDCVDVNPEACALSREVIQALGLTQRVRVLQSDICDFTALAPYDVIFWAALAGINEEEKARIARHLSRTLRTGQMIVVRSSRGVKKLIYAPVDLNDLVGFRIWPDLPMPSGLDQYDFLVEKM
ncbi:MAG: DUF433 domain-containing protein [Chloroflexi bacterium]|jgi:nicotianamine synthase|nr:DUF433 domain-containing protein [Chloroflexota bacterium]